MTTPSRSSTWVPSGTSTTLSAPALPCRPLPWPWVPFAPRRYGVSLNDSNDATLRSATNHTSPPLPPSPPSGPPLGTCASRRNATAPAPPSPPFTCRLHSSTNCCCCWGLISVCARPRRFGSAGRACPRLLGGQDVDQLPPPALAELHLAVDEGEQRVVTAPADVLARVEPGAPLPHDDRAGMHGGTVEGLHPEALGLGIAAVPGG